MVSYPTAFQSSYSTHITKSDDYNLTDKWNIQLHQINSLHRAMSFLNI